MLVNGWTPLSQNLFCIGRVRVGAMVNLFLYLSYDFLGTVCVLLPSIPVGLGVYAVRLGVGLSLRPNEAFARLFHFLLLMEAVWLRACMALLLDIGV